MKRGEGEKGGPTHNLEVVMVMMKTGPVLMTKAGYSLLFSQWKRLKGKVHTSKNAIYLQLRESR